jgi:alkanesulfonate monooxygenase SsuD/methylene tetrahydromethanopterin reductase-like flavin-dependent oxidoreductase (luciferase family)
MENFKIGLLEFGLRSGMNSLQIVNDVVEYVQKADELGFYRFWLGEHHYPNKSRPWNSPTPMIPILASITNKIKIGTAGILLGLHSPYLVACDYKLLGNLFSKRIDLGIANGVIQNDIAQRTVGLSNFKEVIKTFDNKAKELVEILRNEDELYNPEDGLILPPYKGKLPEIWTLSTSAKGIHRALALKTNFCRSLFHSEADLTFDKELIAQYREEFQNLYGCKPTFNVAIHGLCSENNLLIKKTLDNYKGNSSVCIIAQPNEFYDKAFQLVENYGDIDELIIMDIGETSAHRFESLGLVSEIFTHNLEFA